MKPMIYDTFAKAIEQASFYMQYRSKVVHSARWQGADIGNKPEMAMHEVTHCSFGVQMPWGEPAEDISLVDHLGLDIKPNLPWANNHFWERVSGQPMNPGTEWANWPYGKSAATFLENGKFNHNYMERYWPKYAGMVMEPTATPADYFAAMAEMMQDTSLPRPNPHRGIKYDYGDLSDVIALLADDPYTRQAYLPIWFPEDTGGGAKRAPCTIGYHFVMRDDQLDLNYHIRSCDLVRHFRDDLYLTARLILWALEQLAQRDDRWKDVRPGRLFMQIGSLHCFRNDFVMLYGQK